MIRFLARCLIPDWQDTDAPRVRRAYGMLCGVVGIVLNALLFGAKWLAGAMTGSIAIMADAFNNLSDAGASVITLIGFRISGKRNDSEHPFGHGRSEHIAGLMVAMIIIVMGFDLARGSVEKMFAPEPVDFSGVSAAILGASMLVKLYMAMYNASVGRRIQSVAMRATAVDSLSDVAATAAVLASGLAGRFLHINIDAYAGALVSLMILRAGWAAAKETIGPLLGNPPSKEFVSRIQEIVNGCEIVRGIHDLVVHDYGAGRVMISLHAEVPADGDLMTMHDAIDAVERRLSDELGCQAVIHMDPINTDDAQVKETRERVLALLQAEICEELSVHDFRMVSGPTHTNLIFDVLVPQELPATDAAVRAEVCRLVRDMEGSFFAIVTVDRPYL